MLIVIVVFVFLAGAFLIIAVAMEQQSKRMKSERFTNLLPVSQVDDPTGQVRGSFKDRVLVPWMDKATQLATRITPSSTAKTVALQMERAGRPLGLTAPVWGLVRIVAGVLGLVGAMAILRMTHGSSSMRLLGSFAAVAVGGIGPGMWLDNKIKERQWTIKRALPDMIDLLVVSVEAGLGLDAACQEVISRRRGPLMDELTRVLAEVRVGRNRRQSWQDMASRVDVMEMKVFVAALIQAEELGASVAGVLKTQAESIRMRRSLSVREVAAALPVKMLFPLIFFIFPSMFVVILGPGMIDLMTTFTAIGF